VSELQDLLSAEHQILTVLPRLAKMASSSDLKEAITNHYKETKNQVNRLQQIFRILNIEPSEMYCEGMAGILREGNEIVSKQRTANTRDAAIITAAQKVEHYEISFYGSAKAHANRLDLDQVADLLDETLDEEANADKDLTKLAEGSFFTSGINEMAVEETSRR
jgi:ferritin-like metal-binding protein YciE